MRGSEVVIPDPEDLEVELGAVAQDQLETLRHLAKEAEATAFRGFRRSMFAMFSNAIFVALTRSRAAFRGAAMLEDRSASDLRGVRSHAVCTAGRILYLASEQQRRVRVLMVGERRPGELDDCYALFADRLERRSGCSVSNSDRLREGIDRRVRW